MKLAFVYAGQGSQFAGMGKDLYENYPAARAVFDQFPADFDLRTTCFEDPDGLLNQTRYTQPCMLAVAMAITDILAENGITPEMTAGLSLGEYSALYCAGVLDRQTAAELITFRGQAMQKASEGVESGMTAILGLDRELVQKACDQAQAEGSVCPANFNCPGQIVIGGARRAVDAAAQNALLLGARKAVPLTVSGPFHTFFMQPAGDALRERFKSVHFGDMKIPVVFNCLGRKRLPRNPFLSCWSVRCRARFTSGTALNICVLRAWIPSWRSARARCFRALSRRSTNPSRPMPFRTATVFPRQFPH